MTREEANKELERAFDVLDHTCHMDHRRKEAFNMARVALSAEPCDCISRQQALYQAMYVLELETSYDNEKVEEMLRDLPSIQPTTKENLVVGDCISRKVVLDLVEDMTDQFGVEHRVITEGVISMLPPVTPKPKTGHWEQYGYSWEDKFKCSECGKEQPKILCGERIIGHWSDYCPNCGADMRESEDKE